MNLKNTIHKLARISITGLIVFGVISLKAQSNDKKEVTILLSYYKSNDLSKKVVALVKAKKDGRFVAAKHVAVSFYMLRNQAQEKLASVTTNSKGEASLVLPTTIPLDNNLAFSVVSKVENQPEYENAEEQITFKEASISINVNAMDTGRMARAIVKTMDASGKQVPVAGVELKFYVKRLFGVMPAAEEFVKTTDDKGEAVFKYPKNIPGDTAGAVAISVRIEDNEQFGNVEAIAETMWGKVLAVIKDPFPRALWEPYAPLPLVITISTLFGGIWLIYLFIFSQLAKLRKDGLKP